MMPGWGRHGCQGRPLLRCAQIWFCREQLNRAGASDNLFRRLIAVPQLRPSISPGGPDWADGFRPAKLVKTTEENRLLRHHCRRTDTEADRGRGLTWMPDCESPGRNLEPTPRVRMDLAQAVFALCFLLLLVAGIAGSGLSLAEREDSRNIFDTFPSILSGHYQRSRTSGFPLYELTSAWIYYYFGLRTVNLISLVYMLFFATGIIRVIQHTIKDPVRQSFAAVAVILNPIVLTNASGMMETSLYMALFAWSTVYLFAARARDLDFGDLVASQVLAALMVLTRPDSAFSAVAAVLSLLLDSELQNRRVRVLMVSSVCGLVSLAIYLMLNHDGGFLSVSILLYNPIARRLLQAGFGLVNILGLLGGVVLALLPFRIVVAHGAETVLTPILSRSARLLGRLLFLNILFVLPRYFALPDQLDYLAIVASLFWIWAAARIRSKVAVALLCASAALNSLFHISLFERRNDGFVPALSLNMGALFQDWRVREFRIVRASPAFREYVARNVYPDDANRPVFGEVPFYPGLITQGRNPPDVVMDRKSAYVLDNPRFRGWYYKRASFGIVYLCTEELFARRGWPLFQAPMSFAAVNAFRNDRPLHCDAERRLLPSTSKGSLIGR
jgi:hypothetical protein